jgi:single-stranded DNA-binding protein
MQVFGNIANPVEKKTSKAGKDYFRFRLAENQGKEENRTTQWYDVNAFIEELDGDLLSKGMFVKVTGRLVVEAFMKKDNTPGAALTILANQVQPVEKKTQPAGE